MRLFHGQLPKGLLITGGQYQHAQLAMTVVGYTVVNHFLACQRLEVTGARKQQEEEENEFFCLSDCKCCKSTPVANPHQYSHPENGATTSPKTGRYIHANV